MVTSNKVPEKKVVTMSDSNSGVVVPQRTLLGEVNEHITCPLCRGYYIDATTIVECLHSFCRSCIIKHLKAKSYCPVCEMMINSAKPNIKLDKALQDIVYKLVPGLFQKEMERRQHFYSSRPGPAASATPEQRGEDTERIIFSPEDVISFSLEYADVTDTDSISSKSSDSNEPPAPTSNRRYLQCPAVVNISHLKKFLCMKFDIDSTQFAIDILYKRVPLPDYYTLMDIAYIYNWKRNEPMRFIYQIIDYVAIRNRIFDVNRKSYENKSSPARTEDTNVSSPAPHLDQASEASSGTDSPMPDENQAKQANDMKKNDLEQNKDSVLDRTSKDKSSSSSKKAEDEVEKSQFLNSFELTAKSNCVQKTSPVKPGAVTNESTPAKDAVSKNQQSPPKTNEKQPTDVLKRKLQMPTNSPELKKLKIELEKTKLPNIINSPSGASTASGSMPFSSSQNVKASDTKLNLKDSECLKNTQGSSLSTNVGNITPSSIKDVKPQQTSSAHPHSSESSGIKRSVPHHVATSKRKPDITPPSQQQLGPPKSITPPKVHIPKIETQVTTPKHLETPKAVKKIPDLKPSTPLQSKPPLNKLRMDLLANNSDPTIDRSKILSQVKTSLSSPNTPSTSGDPLKSLFDSCKINIPSSLSITLTDQKQDPRNPTEPTSVDPKKNIVNKNLAGASSSLSHKVPSPPVHNYIEILKIPEGDPKKPTLKTETPTDSKSTSQNKPETPVGPPKPANKSSESSAKGPIPNLKPIADTKLAKQVANFSGPITFQQTFEQQLQTLQGDKKSKGPKNKAQVPKLVPVPTTPKAFNAGNKPGIFPTKPSPSNVESKTTTALDLSSPHVQSPSGSSQNFDKAFETMQTIANLAKKQSLPPKMPPMPQNSGFNSLANRPPATVPSPLRIPSGNMNQIKVDKTPGGSSSVNVPRHEGVNKNNSIKPLNTLNPPSTPPNYQMPAHASPTQGQPSPRQTRSPSSSPKLVIAEDKQSNNPTLEQTINQSNQITSSQLPNPMVSKNESAPALPGPSKPSMKLLKPIVPAAKLTPNRHPITPTIKPVDYLRPELMHNTYLNMRKQFEMNAAWMKAQQRQYDLDLIKNMANMAHQSQSDFNKDKQ